MAQNLKRPRRSVLFVPASNQKAIAKIASLDCDAVIFDLEDAVAAAWPAFTIGCRALLADPRSQPVWQSPCAAAASLRCLRVWPSLKRRASALRLERWESTSSHEAPSVPDQ